MRTIVIINKSSTCDLRICGRLTIFHLMVSFLDGVVLEFWHVQYVLKTLVASNLSLVERSLVLIAIDAFSSGSPVQVLEKCFQKGHDCDEGTTQAS
jgi:hypothetical protein